MPANQNKRQLESARQSTLDALTRQRQDLDRVAAWLDHLHPQWAPFQLSISHHFCRERDTDIAQVHVDSPGRKLQGDNRHICHREARQCLEALGYRLIFIPGADLLFRRQRGWSRGLSKHARLAAIAEFESLRGRDIQP